MRLKKKRFEVFAFEARDLLGAGPVSRRRAEVGLSAKGSTLNRSRNEGAGDLLSMCLADSFSRHKKKNRKNGFMSGVNGKKMGGVNDRNILTIGRRKIQTSSNTNRDFCEAN